MSSHPVAIPRRWFLGGLTVAALGAAFTAPGAATAAPSRRHRPWRVGTFNIRHASGPDGVVDLDRTAAVIAAMNVDVVGLQEVDRFWARSGFTDQPEELARRLDMSPVFGANLRGPSEAPGQPEREYGTAVLSRWPITESDNAGLPGRPDAEPRGLLRTRIDAPGGPLRFAVTHLTHNDANERHAQAEAIVAMMGSDESSILCGDFNDEPRSMTVSILATTFADAWRSHGHGRGHTYPAQRPTRRIDYLFSSGDIGATSVGLDTADRDASDHLPLWGEFAGRG